MNPVLRKTVSALATPSLRALARLRIGLARRGADPAGRRLLDVVACTLAAGHAPDDRAWFARIEAMRAAMNASAEPVELVDYGAGGPNDMRSAEEMQRGRRVQSTLGAVCRLASKPPFWAQLLFGVVREYRPRHGIELGTCLAVSAAYQGAALQLNGDGGRLRTFEGADSLARQARRNLDGLGLDNVAVVPGRFDLTLDGALRELGTLDYAFIDGHHDEQATLGYFRQLLPFLAPGAVLVFDDIHWSPGMARAWQAIAGDPRVQVAVDLRAVGLCVLGDGPRERYRFFLP